jgi:hypothetical protein
MCAIYISISYGVKLDDILEQNDPYRTCLAFVNFSWTVFKTQENRSVVIT